MKTLITIVTVVLLVGCGTTQTQKTVEPPSVKAEAPDISIHEAVMLENVEVVKKHLAAGTDVNARGEDVGTPPLHIAALVGSNEIVELLITKGAWHHFIRLSCDDLAGKDFSSDKGFP